jgi:hypothetical protein
MRDSNSNTPPPSRWEKMMYLLLALVQVPFGLITINSEHLAKLVGNPGIASNWTRREVAISVIMLVCCVFAGIGLVDGFSKRTTGRILSGVVLGLSLAVVDLFVLGFFGCCAGLSHL